MLSKMLLTAALAWGAAGASAESLSGTYASLCDSLHITGMEVPASTLGADSDKIRNMSMATLPDEETSLAEALLCSIPRQNLWLEVTAKGKEVNIYGEQSDENCNLLMYLTSPDKGTMLIYIEGTKDLIDEIKF